MTQYLALLLKIIYSVAKSAQQHGKDKTRGWRCFMSEDLLNFMMKITNTLFEMEKDQIKSDNWEKFKTIAECKELIFREWRNINDQSEMSRNDSR